MYRDVISYELNDDVTEEHLLKVAKDVVDSWMSKQPGFVSWEIHANNDGSYSDIVEWATKENAKNAEKDMANIPNANDWFSCYKEGSINSKNLTSIIKF